MRSEERDLERSAGVWESSTSPMYSTEVAAYVASSAAAADSSRGALDSRT